MEREKTFAIAFLLAATVVAFVVSIPLVFEWKHLEAYYGSVVGSAIGFFGLLMGVIVTADLARQRDNRLRAEEMRGILAIVDIEIRDNNRILAVHERMLYDASQFETAGERISHIIGALQAGEIEKSILRNAMVAIKVGGLKETVLTSLISYADRLEITSQQTNAAIIDGRNCLQYADEQWSSYANRIEALKRHLMLAQILGFSAQKAIRHQLEIGFPQH